MPGRATPPDASPPRAGVARPLRPSRDAARRALSQTLPCRRTRRTRGRRRMTHPEPTTTPPNGLPAELRELADEFAFEGVVGRGGTAVVYRARDLTLDRLVAIKVIRSRYVDDDELVARLE